jgi:hypothetical protein
MLENPGLKFRFKVRLLNKTGINIAVFGAKALKAIILNGQDKNLIMKENQVISVDGVGTLIVGSMQE